MGTAGFGIEEADIVMPLVSGASIAGKLLLQPALVTPVDLH